MSQPHSPVLGMANRSRQSQDPRWLRVVESWPQHDVERWIARVIWAFVGIGLLSRVLRYLLRFPLWGDEAALAANFLDRGFMDLLRPLEYQQVAPPLFLWIELLLVRTFGFHEWTLRAFPFLCGLGSVLLFRHVAGQVFRVAATSNDWIFRNEAQPRCCHEPRSPSPLSRRGGGKGDGGECGGMYSAAQLLAVAIFSVSYYPLRHSVEVKQYASDLFVALMLITLSIHWYWNPRQSRWLWWLVAAGPIALGLSHPAAFVAGGISLALTPVIWRSGTLRVWLPFLAYCVVLAAAFAVIYITSTGPQTAAAGAEGIMGSYWARAFPPVTRPLELVAWCIESHCGQLFAYPLGGANRGSGALTLLCCIGGIVFFLRCGRWWLLSLCFAPFVLTFIAAAMQRYPYGGFARTSQHVAPLICLLAGAGIARVMSRFRRDGVRRAALFVPIVALALFAIGLMTRDLLCPFRSEHDRRVREFARWFWHDKAINAELVCACSDLKQPFFRHTYLWRGIAQYLCNQRIYAAQSRQSDRRPDWAAISVEHPLRCVVFSRPGLSRDESAFTAWLDDMQSRFAWVGHERNDFYKPHKHGPDVERIEVYEFVPRPDTDDQGVFSAVLSSGPSLNQKSN